MVAKEEDSVGICYLSFMSSYFSPGNDSYKDLCINNYKMESLANKVELKISKIIILNVI